MIAGAASWLAAWWRALTADWRLLLAIAATYHLFLLFAQFGFLEQLQGALPPGEVQLAMAAMGLTGLASSLATGRALSRRGAEASWVRWGLVTAAAVAAATPLATARTPLVLLAAAVGGSIGGLTVALAGALGKLSASGRPARIAAAGTGLGYLLSNLPPLFSGSTTLRALAPAALALVAAGLAPRAATVEAAARALRRVPALAAATVAFLCLVGLDAAAFAIVHATPELAALSWNGGGWTLAQGGIHLLAAIAAGEWLERDGWQGLLATTWLLFAAGFALLAAGGVAARGGAWLYATGISLYSVALVAFPAATAPGRGAPGPRAGVLFGVSGWLGSALGVGMAQDLGRLPPVAVLAAGGGLGAALLLPRLGAAWRSGRVATWAAPLLVGIAAVTGAWPDAVPPAESSPIARGRAVYIAEGCLHCHSQYVRPGSADETLWGPSRALDRSERPPLVGMRRQGPDLANVGLRRSDYWQEAHLRDPRALVPGSRMPAYAHLFAGEGRRGRDLVAYLGSLGGGHGEERARQIAALPAELPAAPPSAERGGELFARYCAACHGARGRGDGALAAPIARPAMNLAKGGFVRVAATGDAAEQRRELARLVRFGAPPTSMPGHEWLSAEELADLVEFVLALKPDRPAPEAREQP